MSSELNIDRTLVKHRLVQLERPPWDVLSSAELADVIGVSIQVLANWRIREKGPAQVPAGVFRGNRTYYWVYEIERWLRHLGGTQISSWEVVAEWLSQRFYFDTPLTSEVRTWKIVDQLRQQNTWPLKHNSRRRFVVCG